MPFKYDYEPVSKTINIRMFGETTVPEILKYCRVGDGVVPEIIVVHLEKVDNFLFNSDEASIIPVYYKNFKERKNIKGTVLVASSDLHFGVARMFQILFEINNEDDIFIVNSENEAINLVKEELLT
ncbi:MAG: hypothetical protein GY760_28395 [Deltaproteobacteria bacterium]|nr:hypothetical protein [Deltaproteobacteria bacterium]